MLLIVNIYVLAQLQISRFDRYIKLIKAHCDNDEKENFSAGALKIKQKANRENLERQNAALGAQIRTVNSKTPKIP